MSAKRWGALDDAVGDLRQAMDDAWREMLSALQLSLRGLGPPADVTLDEPTHEPVEDATDVVHA